MKQRDEISERDHPKRKWTSRSIGSSFQHGIFYFLVRTGGQQAAYFLLYIVVFYYALFSLNARKKTRYYLSHRFGSRTRFEKFKDTYLMILGFGKVLVDRAIVGILGPEKMNVRFQDREKLLELLDKNQGLILMFSHSGCWQVAMSSMGLINVPVNMLLHHEEGDVDRHYFEHTGQPAPYKVIDPRGYLGGVLEMINVLQEGEILCVMGDRVMGSDSNSVSVDFLGESALFPYSAFKLASATGVPVVVLFSYKTGPAAYEMEVADIIYAPENIGRKGENYRPYVTRFVQVLEKFTRDHPYQFFNFYDMWE